MATAWHRLARAWRRASLASRIAVGGVAACLVVACVALAGTVFMPTRADSPVSVPPAYLAAIETGAQSCPALTPPKLAAQLMAASGFNPAARTSSGGSGIAGLTDTQWKQWTPAPDAARGDAAANILALAHDTCDLVGHLGAAKAAGDPWRLAVAAYRSGLAPVNAAGKVPADDTNYVDQLADYANWYARQPEFSGAGSDPASTAGNTDANAAADAAGQPAGAANWKLTWSDEFNGTAGTAPDANKWGHDTGGNGWGNHELEYYTNSTANAALDGAGHLAITARADDASSLGCWYGACRYTSARLLTTGHFTQLYGRISARIKLPEGKGLWPSFWALGDNISTAGWPQSGELNVMHTYGDQLTKITSGLHGPGYDAFAADTATNGNFANAFHTFTADWYPDHV
ncbi:family 16 glycosylhydrolase, partial [Rugosimonospora acidiphila]|uniref:family 16 glycosylhydrolase n=1 Tax=Rugosimonospora acidiphila TaxID=556531 RepID=UPI0031ED0E62